MNCPVCQKPIKLERSGNHITNYGRFERRASDLKIACEEKILLDSSLSLPHFYKTMSYKNPSLCWAVMIVYPYRITQHNNSTIIEELVPGENRHWRPVPGNSKLSNEQALELCRQRIEFTKLAIKYKLIEI